VGNPDLLILNLSDEEYEQQETYYEQLEKEFMQWPSVDAPSVNTTNYGILERVAQEQAIPIQAQLQTLLEEYMHRKKQLEAIHQIKVSDYQEMLLRWQTSFCPLKGCKKIPVKSPDGTIVWWQTSFCPLKDCKHSSDYQRYQDYQDYQDYEDYQDVLLGLQVIQEEITLFEQWIASKG
jgi:hypothetical protein